jgi:hypothetical protein
MDAIRLIEVSNGDSILEIDLPGGGGSDITLEDGDSDEIIIEKLETLVRCLRPNLYKQEKP